MAISVPSPSSSSMMLYTLVTPPGLGSARLSGKVLRMGDVITHTDELKYVSEAEVGWKPARDRIRWNVTLSAPDGVPPSADLLVNGRVMDSTGKVLRKTEGSVKHQGMLTIPSTVRPDMEELLMEILIEPLDNQRPQLATIPGASVAVDEGGVEIISPEMVVVNDTDTKTDQLTVRIDDPPMHGYLEVREDRKGRWKVSKEFPLSALLREELSYVQSGRTIIIFRIDPCIIQDLFNLNRTQGERAS